MIGIVSEDVKLYMELLTANRYAALNDRTITMLSQGGVDMSATSSEFGAVPASKTVGDAEVEKLLDIETEVEIFVVDKKKTRQGVAFFKYLNLTNVELEKHGLFKSIARNSYKHNCLYPALKAGGLSYIILQHLILTLRNRTIHTCGLTNVCNVLEINIELASLKDAEVKSRTEHYPAGIDFQE